MNLPQNHSTPFPTAAAGEAVSFIVIFSVGITGCFVAVLALGKEFFTGKTSTLVIVAALTWVDFLGVMSTSAIVFHGFVVGNGWIAEYPQCQIQAFCTTACSISSGSIVAFMAIDRTVSLYKPFLYKNAASPSLARVICLSIATVCFLVAALPFMGIGSYIINQTGTYVCHFNWYSSSPSDKSFIIILAIIATMVILLMLVSNVVVFLLVWQLRKKVCMIVLSQMNRKSQRKCTAAKKEQQMAHFVASVSLIFLLTWLPVTVRFFFNFFEVQPNELADLIAIKLAGSGFVANPFTYVIFRNIFKRTLRRSVGRVKKSFHHKIFPQNKTNQVFPDNLSGSAEGLSTIENASRLVTDIFDPKFIGRSSEHRTDTLELQLHVSNL